MPNDTGNPAPPQNFLEYLGGLRGGPGLRENPGTDPFGVKRGPTPVWNPMSNVYGDFENFASNNFDIAQGRRDFEVSGNQFGGAAGGIVGGISELLKKINAFPPDSGDFEPYPSADTLGLTQKPGKLNTGMPSDPANRWAQIDKEGLQRMLEFRKQAQQREPRRRFAPPIQPQPRQQIQQIQRRADPRRGRGFTPPSRRPVPNRRFRPEDKVGSGFRK